MPAETHVRQGGVWNLVNEVHTRVSGSWQEVNFVYYKTGGVWELVHSTAVVTVSGETIAEITTLSTATAGLQVNTDGFLYRRIGGSYFAIDTGTDWIIPHTSASSLYECRITNVVWTVGSTWLVEAAASGVWVALNVNREWSVQDTISTAAGRKLVSFTLEIRLSGGAVLDSASFSLEADYES